MQVSEGISPVQGSDKKGIAAVFRSLPFHDIGEKYDRLGLAYHMPVRHAPAPERLKDIQARFESAGLRVKG